MAKFVYLSVLVLGLCVCLAATLTRCLSGYSAVPSGYTGALMEDSDDGWDDWDAMGGEIGGC